MQDPYSVLGVRRAAPDAEVRSAYRRLVKLHHPDHNQGSPESARRFEAVQEAYAEIQRLRGTSGAGTRTSAGSRGPAASSSRARTHTPPPRPTSDPNIEDRLVALEHQVQQARRARDRAQEAAREAARAAREAAESVRAASASQERPSDEELGYIKTDDTIGKILSDARSQLSDQYGKVRQHPVARRVSDLIDGLEELTEKLDRPSKRPRKR
jgi:hypothetical protein